MKLLYIPYLNPFYSVSQFFIFLIQSFIFFILILYIPYLNPLYSLSQSFLFPISILYFPYRIAILYIPYLNPLYYLSQSFTLLISSLTFSTSYLTSPCTSSSISNMFSLDKVWEKSAMDFNLKCRRLATPFKYLIKIYVWNINGLSSWAVCVFCVQPLNRLELNICLYINCTFTIVLKVQRSPCFWKFKTCSHLFIKYDV